jgi:hypothetical protein
MLWEVEIEVMVVVVSLVVFSGTDLGDQRRSNPGIAGSELVLGDWLYSIDSRTPINRSIRMNNEHA